MAVEDCTLVAERLLISAVVLGPAIVLDSTTAPFELVTVCVLKGSVLMTRILVTELEGPWLVIICVLDGLLLVRRSLVPKYNGLWLVPSSVLDGSVLVKMSLLTKLEGISLVALWVLEASVVAKDSLVTKLEATSLVIVRPEITDVDVVLMTELEDHMLPITSLETSEAVSKLPGIRLEDV